jgi:ribonuclease PH
MPARPDGRKANELRAVKMVRGFTRNAPGSVLIQCGDTHVLCTAWLEEGVPRWKAGGGAGWCTAEYDMLPSATNTRRARNRGRIDGRTQEIQRLIGRSLRAVLSLDDLGENTLLIDCDVLQADGGTRTASITGAYVAAVDAVEAARRAGQLTATPFIDSVAAVSVGILKGRPIIDLSYAEDVDAEVDMNVVMTGQGRFIEVQGTAEKASFDRNQLDRLLALAARGINELTRIQATNLRKRKRPQRVTS